MRGLDIETKKPACLAQSWPGPVSSGSAECGIRWGEDIRSGHSSLQNQTVISIIRRWKQAPVFKLYTFLIKCSVIPCICTWYFNEDYCCGVDRQMQSGDVTKRKADNGGAYIVIGHCHSWNKTGITFCWVYSDLNLDSVHCGGAGVGENVIFWHITLIQTRGMQSGICYYTLYFFLLVLIIKEV